ncbi:MAG: aminopeptidase [Pseudomonadales bacterium]|nr:aminopeptidase [Pseudomonadales bacterium]MCP5214053.1 aminopeptidase [Pseudomonadales bacterium]MCP5302741.1 aminopeptidase [Pseudomonadales bacterium]
MNYRNTSWLFILLLVLGLSGCETLSYYGQAVDGHLRLLRQSKEVSHYIASVDTPTQLKIQLKKVMQLRVFAEEQLLLPVNKQYSRYVSLDRKYVVWNVFATPEFSLQPKTWCYPIAGCTNYRGYYAEQNARKYAAKLVAQGYDVYVAGIAAYSTLGWFRDPILSSFIQRSDAELANLLFHELSHQLLYVKDDTVFNESFATVVAQEGVKRWLQQQNNPTAYQDFLEDQRQQREFIDLVISYQKKLATLYASSAIDSDKRIRKATLIAQLKQDYLALKTSWDGQSDYDHWFHQEINNAQLSTVSTYFDLVPELTALLSENDDDLARFYAASRALAEQRGE